MTETMALAPLKRQSHRCAKRGADDTQAPRPRAGASHRSRHQHCRLMGRDHFMDRNLFGHREVAMSADTASHQSFRATLARMRACGAEVSATFDADRGVIEYRIAGLRKSVQAEIDR